MGPQLCIVLLTLVFIYINCEWIEITPIENKKQLSNSKFIDVTTSGSYENNIRTPFGKTEITTTPAYVSYEESSTNLYNYDEEKTFTEFAEEKIAPKEFLNSSDNYIHSKKKEHLGVDEFIPFLKVIQTNLLKIKKLHKSKMSMLKHLRDHLLINIKDSFTSIWRFKSSSEARGYDEEESHMDFPSNEGALMTIGFLTFAVFLIKLVIKLIHALKNKQQNYGITTTTTAASVVFLKRRKRDEQYEEMNRILQYIEEF